MARFPAPVAGLVVRYDFLWPDEHAAGHVSGKNRPACVVLVVDRSRAGLDPEVVFVPITHRPPAAGTIAVEIPIDEKRRLGLDDDRSWIVLESVNQEEWPQGLAPTGIDGRPYAYGRLSGPLLRQVGAGIASAVRAGRMRIVPRS